MPYTQLTTTTATGELLGNGPSVLRFATDTPFTVPSGGAARLEATETPFGVVTITPFAANTGLTGIEFNPLGGSGGTFTLTALDQFGSSSTSAAFALGNGNNFVNVQTSASTLLTKLTVNASGNIIGDIRQVRIGDTRSIDGPAVSAVPVPATVLLAAASAACLVGARGLRRRVTGAV
jgi:hypothetical protein